MTLVELFQAQASAQSDDAAVVDLAAANSNSNSTITYRDLDHASTHFASHLHTEYGVRPGVKIPLVTSRSISMVIATLAILKLRCCYVPIDAAMWSGERIVKIVHRLGAELIVSTEEDFDLHPSSSHSSTSNNGSGMRQIPRVARLGAWADERTRLLAPAAATPSCFDVSDGSGGDDWAYMIFTSGQFGERRQLHESNYHAGGC